MDEVGGDGLQAAMLGSEEVAFAAGRNAKAELRSSAGGDAGFEVGRIEGRVKRGVEIDL
jgi:hypothetical protein